LETVWFESLKSTQKKILKDLESGVVKAPIAYYTPYQSEGIGSRGNRWIGCRGNFFLSFAIDIKSLPKDMPLASSSIYFSFILKDVLAQMGSKVWIKWPNDFYLDKKVGGTVTNLKNSLLVVGIGLNLTSAPQGFQKLDVDVDARYLLNRYFTSLSRKTLWKEIFSKYKIEFQKSRDFFVKTKRGNISLKNAVLLEDGSIEINGERIYNLR